MMEPATILAVTLSDIKKHSPTLKKIVKRNLPDNPKTVVLSKIWARLALPGCR